MSITDVFKRSWQITKLSFSVIGKDKEMLSFPILGGFFSILFVILMVFPTIVLSLMSGDELGITSLGLLFITYLGLSFIATFFNVCTVYTTKTRFEGGDATFKESIKFAAGRWTIILKWSLLAATVGILLRLLDIIAERLGGVGELILNIVTSLIGMAWSIVTIFVVPGLVYYNLGPFDAVKRSAQTLKQTWGESLIRYFGLGIIELLILIPGAIILGILAFASLNISLIIAGVFAVLTIIYTAAVLLTFSVANQVFNTALFVYAETGQVPSQFNEELLKNAFQPHKKK